MTCNHRLLCRLPTEELSTANYFDRLVAEAQGTIAIRRCWISTACKWGLVLCIQPSEPSGPLQRTPGHHFQRL